MHDVFISYSSKDLDITEQVRRILETNGISCWIAPRNIPSGSSYAAEIPAAIRGCTVFLLIGSLNAENSPWIRKELERAIIERKKIIPLMVEDVAFHDEFDFLLSLHQRYAAYEKTAEVMERLVKDIRAILGKPALVEPTLPPIPNLRFDGFYIYSHPSTQGFRTYYRFFPNGTVVSANTAAEPVHVVEWLDESQNHGSKITVENGTVWMTEVMGTGDTHRSKLTIEKSFLLKEGYDYRALKNVTKKCTFLSFDDIAKPATAQTPALRFDGFYLGPVEGDFRSYYRFYPNGLMVSAFTCATPAQAYEWLNETQDEGGKFVVQNDGLWMTEPLSDGHTYHAQLTVKDDKLFMDGYNSWSKQTHKKECTFLPFHEIK